MEKTAAAEVLRAIQEDDLAALGALSLASETTPPALERAVDAANGQTQNTGSGYAFNSAIVR